MDALEQAKRGMKFYEDEIEGSDTESYTKEMALAAAQAYAAIAQAEQLKRIADGVERQANAVEKRNELLEEYNKVSAEQHAIYRSDVIDLFGRLFVDAEQPDAEGGAA